LLAAGLAAFCVYFAMYAFRKPVMAIAFADQHAVLAGLDYKATLIIAQAVGYALSKMLGVKVVAEHAGDRRARLILSLVGASWVALLGFALLPARFGPLCLFLNGLPLGMIWGLVFRYLEGRRVSELLAAMLTASFILSSGATKTAGALLVQNGVSPFWMPAVAGLLFAPVLVVALAVLARTPPPDARDRAERGERVAMDRAARHAYLRAHAIPLAALVTGYTILAALRDFRDNFAAELWSELGNGTPAAIFSLTEIPVTLIVLAGLALLAMVRSNVRAMLAIHAAILFGAVTLCVATLAFRMGAVGPVAWMVLVGIGIYSAYAPFSAVLFDRMMSLSRSPGNAGFLIYVADSFGYVGSVALLLLRELEDRTHWLGFFTTATLVTGGLLAAATLVSGSWFFARYVRRIGQDCGSTIATHLSSPPAKATVEGRQRNDPRHAARRYGGADVRFLTHPSPPRMPGTTIQEYEVPMVDLSRRTVLSAGAALAGAAALPASIAQAAAIGPDRRSGTIADVEHVVILCQENRGFDHYFGTLRGVRGFGDRFPVPTAAGNIWRQTDRTGGHGPRAIAPFHLDTAKQFELMRMEGTPHSWPDAQRA
jgi:hypothetical protein